MYRKNIVFFTMYSLLSILVFPNNLSIFKLHYVFGIEVITMTTTEITYRTKLVSVLTTCHVWCL